MFFTLFISVGVATSRSGRLRKKSSKLADYESSEEMDNKSSPKKSSPDKIFISPNKIKVSTIALNEIIF